MAKQRLIPKAPDDDKREPHEKFSDFAAKIVTVSKAEIDARERTWKHQREHLKRGS